MPATVTGTLGGVEVAAVATVLGHEGVDHRDTRAAGGQREREVRADEPETPGDEAGRASEGGESMRVGVGHGGAAGGEPGDAERSLWPPTTHGHLSCGEDDGCGDASRSPARSAVEAGVVGLIAIVIAAIVLSVWNAHWHEPFAYDGDAMYYAMVVKTIGRYGTYLHNPHLGWPFGQNLADYPEGADNLNWFMLAVGQWLTGSAFTAMNFFYVASFGAVAAVAHAVLRVLGVRQVAGRRGCDPLRFPAVPLRSQRDPPPAVDVLHGAGGGAHRARSSSPTILR